MIPSSAGSFDCGELNEASFFQSTVLPLGVVLSAATGEGRSAQSAEDFADENLEQGS
jgi:hypothetical protein